MASNNILHIMTLYDLKKPMSVEIFEEENSNDQIKETCSQEPNVTTNTQILQSKEAEADNQNILKKRNIKHSGEQINHKRRRSETHSRTNEKDQKIPGNNVSFSAISQNGETTFDSNCFYTSSNTQENNNNTINDPLNIISRHLITLMESFNNCTAIKRNTKYIPKEIYLARKSYLTLKYSIFKESYDIVCNKILPLENNINFVDWFLNGTVEMVNNKVPKTKDIIRCLYDEMLKWVKQRKQKNPVMSNKNNNQTNEILIEILAQPSITASENSPPIIVNKQNSINEQDKATTNNTVNQIVRQHNQSVIRNQNRTLTSMTNVHSQTPIERDRLNQQSLPLYQHFVPSDNNANMTSLPQNVHLNIQSYQTNNQIYYNPRSTTDYNPAPKTTTFLPQNKNSECAMPTITSTNKGQIPSYIGYNNVGRPTFPDTNITSNTIMNNSSVLRDREIPRHYTGGHNYTPNVVQNKNHSPNIVLNRYQQNNLVSNESGYLQAYLNSNLVRYPRRRNSQSHSSLPPPPPPPPPPPHPTNQNIWSDELIQPMTQNSTMQLNAQNETFEYQNHMTRSVSTDSGFVSPVNCNNMQNGNIFEDAMERLFEPEPIFHAPEITHVTSLNPNATSTRRGYCRICGKPSKDMCSACYKTYYCSPECQRLDWTSHRFICKV